MFQLSSKSLSRMDGVHPDLITVIERAIELTPYDFGISEGVRSVEEQRKNLEAGKSQTMDSKHLPQADGFGHAVDLFVLVEGKATWDHKYFRKVVQAVFTAAIELGVQIEAGALWRDFIDSPHIQLNGDYYD